jgi:hypothetical protein
MCIRSWIPPEGWVKQENGSKGNELVHCALPICVPGSPEYPSEAAIHFAAALDYELCGPLAQEKARSSAQISKPQSYPRAP